MITFFAVHAINSVKAFTSVTILRVEWATCSAILTWETLTWVLKRKSAKRKKKDYENYDKRNINCIRLYGDLCSTFHYIQIVFIT